MLVVTHMDRLGIIPEAEICRRFSAALGLNVKSITLVQNYINEKRNNPGKYLLF
jgi:hypothetical protein